MHVVHRNLTFYPLKNGANEGNGGRATIQERAAGASEKSPPLTVDFEGLKNASKPSERHLKSCKRSLSNDMLWSDPYTFSVTGHNGIAQAEVSAHYNIGPDSFIDWDPEEGTGDFGKETKFWSAYRDTSDGEDNNQKAETQECDDRPIDVGQVFRCWMTLSAVVQLPAHDSLWWGEGETRAEAIYVPDRGQSVDSFTVYLEEK